MKLKRFTESFSGFLQLEGSEMVLVESLQIDSRQVKTGSLFFCLCDDPILSARYIAEAESKGATAIVCGMNLQPHNGAVSRVLTTTVRDFLAHAISLFYQEVLSRLSITGVTGTNGKTSIAYMLASQLDGYYVGTIGIGMVSQLLKTAHTTPEALTILNTLKQTSFKKLEVCLECSSHALFQQRLQGLPIKTAVWTNLTHDHLDYHKTPEAYFEAKCLLFTRSELELAVINQDCPYGLKLIERLNRRKVQVLTYSLHKKTADAFCRTLSTERHGMRLELDLFGKRVSFTTPLQGEFNVSNLLAAALVFHSKGFVGEQLLEKMQSVQPVIGRMELILQRPSVYLDYAHTPDALEKALKAVKSNFDGKVWCVFGCGGDRDKEKRQVMGKVASSYADKLVITSDNPRSEEPEAIIEEILQGVAPHTEHYCIASRKEALSFALNQADQTDRILIAGKGHETTQEFATKTISFSDKNEILTLSNSETCREK